MSNLALKYRPNIYDEVIGNKKAVKELKRRAEENDFSKVVLFTGVTGTGKTTLQKIYIKTILCENKKGIDPCNVCPLCLSVDKENTTEYLYFYEGGLFGVKEAEGLVLRTSKNVLGRRGKPKIFVIDELQSIKSKAAEEILLKVLERKGDNCYYVLGAMRWYKIGPAIKNRALTYHLSLESTEIAMHVLDIFKREKIEVDSTLKKVIVAIVRSSMGSMRTAISLCERVIYSGIKDEEELINELGIISQDTLYNTINGFLKGDVQSLQVKLNYEIVDQILYKLSLVYKGLAGYKLTQWEVAEVSAINSTDVKTVERFIIGLNELKKYPYFDRQLIDFLLIRSMLQNKERLISELEIPSLTDSLEVKQDRPVRQARPKRQARK